MKKNDNFITMYLVWQKMREIVLDIETTGLSFSKGDKIIEIGCVELKNKIITEKFFHKYVNPKISISQESYNIHGISEDFLKDKPSFNEIIEEFLDFVKDDVLIIHNAIFDFPFINHELALNKRRLLTNNVIDTLKEARKKFPGSPLSLNALCKRFSISLESRTKHGALVDAELLAKVYIELSGGIQTNFLSITEDVQKKEQVEIKKKEERVFVHYHRRQSLQPTQEELTNHNNYISSIKENIWGKLK